MTSIWTCPACHRPFKHKNQAHSCVTIDAAAHIDNKSPNVQATYKKLEQAVRKFGSVKVSPTKSSIMFVSGSTFLAVKPKRAWIDIEFLLEREVHDYPVHKTFRANKSRVAHFVRLESPKDVSGKVLSWLRQSHALSAGGK